MYLLNDHAAQTLFDVSKFIENATRKNGKKTSNNCDQPQSRPMGQEVRKNRHNVDENMGNDSRGSKGTAHAYQRYMNKQKQRYGNYTSKNVFTDYKAASPSEPPQRPHRFKSGNSRAPFCRVGHTYFNFFCQLR